MKVIRIEDVPEILPANHHNLHTKYIVNTSMGAKSMKVGIVRLEANGRSDRHTHPNGEQLFIMLKGEMVVKTDQGEVRLKQGEAAFIYPGEVHENYNVAEGVTEYIGIQSLVP